MSSLHDYEADAESQVIALLPTVEEARKAGLSAYNKAIADKGDLGSAGWAWACIPITPQNKPLIRALDEENIGSFDGWNCDYRIQVSDLGLLRGDVVYVQSIEVQRDGLEAFAGVIRSAGFAATLSSRVD